CEKRRSGLSQARSAPQAVRRFARRDAGRLNRSPKFVRSQAFWPSFPIAFCRGRKAALGHDRQNAPRRFRRIGRVEQDKVLLLPRIRERFIDQAETASARNFSAW